MQEQLVAELDITVQVRLQFLAALEAITLQDVFDLAIETLDYAGSVLAWIAALIFGVVVACL